MLYSIAIGVCVSSMVLSLLLFLVFLGVLINQETSPGFTAEDRKRALAFCLVWLAFIVSLAVCSWYFSQQLEEERIGGLTAFTGITTFSALIVLLLHTNKRLGIKYRQLTP